MDQILKVGIQDCKLQLLVKLEHNHDQDFNVCAEFDIHIVQPIEKHVSPKLRAAIEKETFNLPDSANSIDYLAIIIKKLNVPYNERSLDFYMSDLKDRSVSNIRAAIMNIGKYSKLFEFNYSKVRVAHYLADRVIEDINLYTMQHLKARDKAKTLTLEVLVDILDAVIVEEEYKASITPRANSIKMVEPKENPQKVEPKENLQNAAWNFGRCFYCQKKSHVMKDCPDFVLALKETSKAGVQKEPKGTMKKESDKSSENEGKNSFHTIERNGPMRTRAVRFRSGNDFWIFQ